MKNKIIKSTLLLVASLSGVSLLVGNAFASYIVSPASTLGVRISIESQKIEYSLYNSATPTVELSLENDDGVLVPDGTASSYLNMPVNYNETLKIKEIVTTGSEVTSKDIATFTPTVEGTYDFASYDLDNESFDVSLNKKAVYLYTASPVKIYDNAAVYAFHQDGNKDVADAEWPGTEMNKSTAATNRYIYRQLVSAATTKVIFSSLVDTNQRTQTVDLTYPDNYLRPTYNLVTYRENGDNPNYSGQGTWSEYPSSFTTTDQTNASSNLYFVGSMTDDFKEKANYSFTYIYTSNNNNENWYTHVITLSLTKDQTFKAKQGGVWAGCDNNVPGFTTDEGYFTATGYGNNIVVKTSGVYRFFVNTKDAGDVWFTKAVKVS